MAYYRIDWDAIRALTPREQLEVLADIAATVPVEMAQERVRIVGRTVERHAAERPWGAQARAAEELGLGTARVGQLWTEYKEHHMTTASYGTFIGNVADPGGAGSMRDYITTALGDYADDYDIDEIIADYRDAINDALDGTGITLAGDEFYGPHPPRPENVAETIADAIESVDFWTIVERHDKSEN